MKIRRRRFPQIKTRNEAAAWLAGFVDGEGCVYSRNHILANGKNHQTRVITITNTDKALIDFSAHCFTMLGIEYGLSDRAGASVRHKHRYIIEVRKGAAMWRFREWVPIQAPEKKQRLDSALLTYRGLHCADCGCLHDEKTEGCAGCRKRHYFRNAQAKVRAHFALDLPKATESTSLLA